MTQKIKKITASEAAKVLKISKARVLQLINAGVIPSERIGNQFVLRKPDVLAARGRKSGRPRKHPAKPAPVAQQLSSDEIRRNELLNLINERSQPKPLATESPIFQREPTVLKIPTMRKPSDNGLDFDD